MSKIKPIIDLKQIGIGSILKSHYLKVPPNQREYSWTSDKEVDQLFKDLAKAIADDESEYFLGSIVTIPGPSGILEVIDGQQRLATITMLLCNIRRYLKGKDDIIADDIDNFLYYTDRNQRAVLNRLTMNNTDNEFFRTMLLDASLQLPPEPSRRSHRLICDAFDKANERIKTIVAPYGQSDHGDILNKWVNFIEHNADVILLQVSSGANAYKMFETLNARGLRTTQADLVKNYLFGQAGDARLPEAQDHWMLMRGALESIQDEEKEDMTVDFLRHSLVVMRGFLRKENVYEVVQQAAKGSQSSMTFLRTTESLVNIYVATFNRDHEKWNTYSDSIRLAVQTLNFFDIHPFRPAFLAVALKYDPKEALKAFQILISLGVRLLIAASTRSGSVEETLAWAANQIYLGKISTAEELKQGLSGMTPSDSLFQQEFETASVTNGAHARYYLRTLERVAKKAQDPWYMLNEDKEAINLEHILPEKPGTNYPQFKKEETAIYWKRLGNQVLMRKQDNSALRSSSFSDKARVYKDSPYLLTSQVAAVPDWTTETIKERQKGLAKLALKAWPI
jgi:hypothetical protein